MKSRSVLFLVIIMLFTLGGCVQKNKPSANTTNIPAVNTTANQSKVEPVDAGKVVMMEIDFSWTKKITYERESNKPEITKFVDIYNKSVLYRNDVGTTPDINITLTLEDGQKIEVSGNTQHFQEVQRNGKHFKVENQELWNYFKQLINS